MGKICKRNYHAADLKNPLSPYLFNLRYDLLKSHSLICYYILMQIFCHKSTGKIEQRFSPVGIYRCCFLYWDQEASSYTSWLSRIFVEMFITYLAVLKFGFQAIGSDNTKKIKILWL